MEKTQDAGGKITEYVYDALGRRIAVSDPMSQTTYFAYDALGNQTAITDANGIVTAYAYDALSRLIAVIENHQPTQPPNQQTNVRTEYAYDVLGHRTVITNARAYTQSFTTYDVLGRPVSVEDALGHRTFTAYDALGRRTIVTDADGLVTHYFYDGLNRLVEIQYPDAVVEYAYDALGRRTTMTDTAGVTTYAYDDLGRVIRVTDPFTGVVEYGYDLAGNRTALTVTTPGHASRITHYEFDADNRLIQVTDWATGTTTNAYDPAGRLSATTLPNGVVTTHGYDPAGRLTALTHTHNGALLARYAYTLDAAGNRTCVTETVSGVTRVITYTYDDLYRLTEADYSTGENYAYQYDVVGNRTAMTNTAVHTYTYDAANRLTIVDGVAQSWDDRGNLVYDGVYTYTYNAAGRMVQVESITTTVVYTYTADGLRVAQAVAGDVSTFVWDWATGVPEMLGDGNNLYLIGYDTLGWDDGDAWTFVLPDALGSVRQEVDATGTVLAVREWSPYGVEVGTAQAGLGYTGEWYDANVGLTYLRARWYDSGTGRFTQMDPSRLEANLYLYATANPVSLLDPSGLCADRGSSTDCERFVAEVQLIIDTVKKEWGCNTLKPLSDANVIIDFLAYYYSGIPATGAGFYLSWLRFDSFFQQGTPDRWAVPDWQGAVGFPDFEWNHPINELDSPLGQEMRGGYGFRRPYFDNTHHYFGYLKLAYYYGTSVANIVNFEREKPTLDDVRSLWQSHIGTLEEQDHERRYAWYYREAIYDLYIVHEATVVAFATNVLFDNDISFLPQLLHERWCASNDADVWALEGDVDKYYFDFPQRYWPPQKYWPGSNN